MAKFAFNRKEDAEGILADYRRRRGKPQRGERIAYPQPKHDRSIYIAKTGGSGIPARSGDTPGSAEVTICKINEAGTLVTTSRTETAYNLSASAVAAGV